ncbi:MAG: ribonuclease P protein component [Chlamydiales bacterium]
MKFKKSQRLLSQKQFRLLAKQGTVLSGDFLRVQLRHSLHPKLGLTVTRRFGKAHDRNRFKRLVREAYRLSQKELGGVQINVSPLQKQLIPTFPEIRRDLLRLATTPDAVSEEGAKPALFSAQPAALGNP